MFTNKLPIARVCLNIRTALASSQYKLERTFESITFSINLRGGPFYSCICYIEFIHNHLTRKSIAKNVFERIFQLPHGSTMRRNPSGKGDITIFMRSSCKKCKLSYTQISKYTVRRGYSICQIRVVIPVYISDIKMNYYFAFITTQVKIVLNSTR